MGRLDKSEGSAGDIPERPCPKCGNSMRGEPNPVGGQWECRDDSCREWGTTYFDQGGDLVVALRRVRDPCMYCQESLSGGASYLPWEDGSNSSAYIICPSCGEQNFR
jgi:hypothetical protein